jgi:hypothetical protein
MSKGGRTRFLSKFHDSSPKNLDLGKNKFSDKIVYELPDLMHFFSRKKAMPRKGLYLRESLKVLPGVTRNDTGNK